MPKKKLLRHIVYEDGKPPRHVNDQFLDGNSEQAKNARKHNRSAGTMRAPTYSANSLT
jgi:hypothetical protein